MKCPACGLQLIEVKIGTLTVDACHGGCGGIWFDNFELQQVDEPDEKAGEALLNIPIDPTIHVDLTRKRTCPRCPENQPMRRHFFSVKRKVEIDECPACGGYWLDAGELAQIRHAYPTDGERRTATSRYFEEVSHRTLEGSQPMNPIQTERARRASGAFKYISRTLA
jgi:Zn-finger nucleic acid-binding protein